MGNALAQKESHWVRECTHKQGGFTWLTIPPVGGMQISEDKAPKQPSAPSIDTAAAPTQPQGGIRSAGPSRWRHIGWSNWWC